jgi:hypothetical protein
VIRAARSTTIRVEATNDDHDHDPKMQLVGSLKLTLAMKKEIAELYKLRMTPEFIRNRLVEVFINTR